MPDIKMELRDVVRAGMLRGMTAPVDLERAEQAGITLAGLTCVRFVGSENGFTFDLRVIVDVGDRSVEETIEAVRQRVTMSKIRVE
ncbi:MAG: hypothetical protein J0J01_19800 [Reyranella sp.]|uniref:hypothetical protein n=1 Tax=Reyranella sp. TaxID=1929291 RepID=UPI001AC547CF|nr:hypothetical protein [Reyranella sp.]MBN9089156.1 hypothetical protein [Reyranella sp.]